MRSLFFWSALVLGIALLAIPVGIKTASAEPCILSTRLLNQDPYPVLPGDRVKIVFQVSGVNNVECGRIIFELQEDFPLVFDSSVEPMREIRGGTFSDTGFSTSWMIPYEVKIDEDAPEDENDIEVSIHPLGETTSPTFRRFNITVEDVRTDFEISIKNFNQETASLTFEILNIGDNDAEAVTIKMTNQDNVRVFGASQETVGSLDASEDTTFTFEALPQEGAIMMTVDYTDEIGERRNLEKSVEFDPVYFTGGVNNQGSTSPFLWLFLILLLAVIIFFIYRYFKNKKKRKKKLDI